VSHKAKQHQPRLKRSNSGMSLVEAIAPPGSRMHSLHGEAPCGRPGRTVFAIDPTTYPATIPARSCQCVPELADLLQNPKL